MKPEGCEKKNYILVILYEAYRPAKESDISAGTIDRALGSMTKNFHSSAAILQGFYYFFPPKAFEDIVKWD